MVIQAGNVAFFIAADHDKCVPLVPIAAVPLRKNPAPILLAKLDSKRVKIHYLRSSDSLLFVSHSRKAFSILVSSFYNHSNAGSRF